MNETRHANATEPRRELAAGHGSGFLKGVVGGALIGTAAGVLFAPQIRAALRNVQRQLTDVAAGVSDTAAEEYRETTTRVGDAVVDLQQTGRAVYGRGLSAVVRGAEEVKERATEARGELDESPAAATPRRSS